MLEFLLKASYQQLLCMLVCAWLISLTVLYSSRVIVPSLSVSCMLNRTIKHTNKGKMVYQIFIKSQDFTEKVEEEAIRRMLKKILE